MTEPAEIAPPSILVFGALAYDTLATYLPNNATKLAPVLGNLGQANTATQNLKLHQLADRLGGCAGNIAYGLHLANQPSVVCAVVGEDFSPAYQDHFQQLTLSTNGLLMAPGPSARALIFTAAGEEQQLTAFYPGPPLPETYPAHVRRLLQQTPGIASVVQAAAAPTTTLINAEASAATTCRVWSPGQYTAEFSADQLQQMLGWSNLLVLNQQEFRWLSKHQPLDRLPPTIVTAGADPLTLVTGEEQQKFTIPTANALDPTGCGDAFLAGLLASLNHTIPTRLEGWQAAISQGIQFASACLGSEGCQSYQAPSK